MKSTAPNLHVTIKLHKPNTPIWPIINWEDSTAYEVSKYLRRILHNYIDLPYTYDVHNFILLITDLRNHETKQRYKNMFFDTESRYNNIPKYETINIISNIIKITRISKIIETETLHLIYTIMGKLLQIQPTIIQKIDWLPIRSLISAILTETYIQYMERTQKYIQS